MVRKRASLMQFFLNTVIRSLPEQTRTLSNQVTVFPQQLLPANRDEWCVYWKEQGQAWRTEPEISNQRQEYLAQRRMILPNIEDGIYPFKNIKLNRADIEWLLATLDGYGPVDWDDESQKTREGLDLRGADLYQADLSGLPLAKTRGGLTQQERMVTTRKHRRMAALHLEHADLSRTHFEGAILRYAYLEEANLEEIHLEMADCAAIHLQGSYLYKAHLNGASLRRAFLNAGTFMNDACLGNESTGFVSLVDVRWEGVNLATVDWHSINMIGEEQIARQATMDRGNRKQHSTRLFEHETAVRANRQLAVVLQSQGLNEDAAYFSYRAQILQKHVFWFQMIQQHVKLRQRMQALGSWFFSWFLFLVAGYGYRLWRSFLVYMLMIIGFAAAYYLLGSHAEPSLSLVNALALSMTSFHGRGFFPGFTQLNDTLTLLASIEAFVGLVLEVTLIATLTQRFFGK